MKNHAFPQHQLALQSLVNRISINAIPSAIKKHSLIINDVPADLQVKTDEHMLATIFSTLLNTMIDSSENSCIRISAKSYGKIALIYLRESPQINNFVLSRKLKQIQELAGAIGGAISIGREDNKATSIVLSFTNDLSLAA